VTPATALPPAAERVAAGSAWLDEHRPGWWKRIDTHVLDLSSCVTCVLGQEFAVEARRTGSHRSGYGYGAAQLIDDPDAPDDEAALLGFDIPSPYRDEGYAELTAAWLDEIERRRAADQQPADVAAGLGHEEPAW
jgi:hypothetical protein